MLCRWEREREKRLLPEREKGRRVDCGAGRLCRWERIRRKRILPEREKERRVGCGAGRLCRWERKRRKRLLPEREKGRRVGRGAGRLCRWERKRRKRLLPDEGGARGMEGDRQTRPRRAHEGSSVRTKTFRAHGSLAGICLVRTRRLFTHGISLVRTAHFPTWHMDSSALHRHFSAARRYPSTGTAPRLHLHRTLRPTPVRTAEMQSKEEQRRG